MSFKPSGQLEKYGWKKGCGMGKDGHGIKEAIKVKLKFDNTGVGHDLGEQFTYHWWEKAYNDASQTLDVTEDQHGLQMKKMGSSVVSTKKISKSLSGKSLLYGAFVKAATLTNGTEEREDDSCKDSDSDSSDSQKVGSVMSDEDLFRICGSRTAHKGARHGLKANGKLARIALQDASQGQREEDRLRIAGAVDQVDTESERSEKLRKKKSKMSNRIHGEESEPVDLQSKEIGAGTECTVQGLDRSTRLGGLGGGGTRDSCVSQTEGDSVGKKKCKKKRKRRKEEEGMEDSIQQWEGDVKKAKKKKKHKH